MYFAMGGVCLNRRKDFIGMDVFNVEGKKIGNLSDIYLDFFKGKVIGFKVTTFSLFSKEQFVFVEDVLSLNEIMVISKLSKMEGVSFLDIKDLEVINQQGKIIGVVEDLIINIINYSIKGIIVSSGIFHKMFVGKKIILINNCILGDGDLLYREDERISFNSLPHNLVASNE